MKNIMIMMNNSLIKLPSPSNISIWWNLGFMLGMILMMQLITGLFLSMHYDANSLIAFNSIIHMIRDVNYGWMIQNIHMNGASLFFIMIYIHIARGLYFSLYLNKTTWLSGFFIFMILMLSAFMGYVLPWGQMSFWGATVITNLLSAVPYVGNLLVIWIWGGFSVDNATLSRFFIFHFIFPFIMVIMVIMHLFFLHEKGSNNPLGTYSDFDKIPFMPYFLFKDMTSFFMLLVFFISLSFFYPLIMSDPDNFIMANPMTTPTHIQPEWYFLFAYAILRSIPNKLGGVIGLMMSLFILLIIPWYKKNYLSSTFNNIIKMKFWFLIIIFMILTFIGSMPVEQPFILIGQMTSCIYFTLFIVL